MSLFLEWNSILLEEYFSPAKLGQDVWIPTTRLELDGIGVHKGGANGLIQAVKQGLAWQHGGNIAAKARELAKQRLSHRFRNNHYKDPGVDLDVYQEANAPTYLPYIAIWVLARSEAEDGFYAKVSELIDEPFPNNTRQQMEAVWSDLAYWSTEQQKGKFGRFKLNVLGEHRFVGMAYAQAMVTHKDMDGLKRLFGSCRLHPGQALNNDHFTQLLEHGQNSHYLSVGLKDAMGKQEYRDHLKQLFCAYLEFWDGRVPKHTSVSGPSNSHIVPQELENDELSVILKMNSYGEAVCWEIGWRLPAIVTGLSYLIKVNNDYETKAKLEFLGTHLNCVSSVNQNGARIALNQSALQEVESTLLYKMSDGGQQERKIYLRKDKIRVLAWDRPDPSLTDSLLEREMPVTGPAYLLYSLREYSNLELLLTNEDIDYQLIDDIDGLPDEWGLICVTDTASLTPEQRAVIVDEEPTALAKARIRIIGGKPIIGAGSKKYAYYDLPIVELDAPAGTVLTSLGLTFEELKGPKDNDEPGAPKNVLIRRFKFTLNPGSGCVFKIKAVLGDEELCTAGLQILASGGVATSQRSNFSIDKFGRVGTDASGLLGAVIGDAPEVDLDIDYYQVDEKTFTDSRGVNVWKSMEFNTSSLFLDSLASTNNGFMSYGVARDQIKRLANNVGIDDIEPALLIRELRRRGHVEIKTDVKGHMVGVCVVPPTLYSLPITDHKQRQMYGVCGSLRMQQWKELGQATDCMVFVESCGLYNLPVVRLSSPAPYRISELAKSANFQEKDLPFKKLSQWLGSIQEIKENLSWYKEQGLTPNYLMRLNPGKCFFKAADHLLVDSSLKFELFKYEDQQIQGLSVYKLGENLGDGTLKYSFIEDSRWGVWMAMNAFSEWLKNPPYNRADASPWPIHYDQIKGCLWLPARMEPPFVLERALTFCSGSGPILTQVTRETDGDSILLSEKDKNIIGRVSMVYYEMTNEKKWLCYRWVPEVIASHIANLLGGEIRKI